MLGGLILYIAYVLVIIVFIIAGYNYYIKYRNCITPFSKLNTFPSVCNECIRNDVVHYVKYVDQGIYHKMYVDHLVDIIWKIFDIIELPNEVGCHILQYVDFKQKHLNNIFCCKTCFHMKYLNKTVKPWEVWNYFNDGYIPKIHNKHSIKQNLEKKEDAIVSEVRDRIFGTSQNRTTTNHINVS